MTKLTTTKFKTHVGNQLIESLNELANSAYYVFTADHTARTTNTIPTPADKERETNIDAYRNMIFGKRLTSSDMKLMVRSVPYASGSYYSMYDDNDDSLFNKDFFVIVDEFSFKHVYKCLDNNGNTVSNAEPNFAHITGSNTEVYRTSDGFLWKYMYSISASEHDQFATASYIPVIANTSVESNAVPGALDVIKVEEGGKNYGNYTAGTFVGSDVRIGGNTVLYKVSNNSINTTNGYYTGCLMYIVSGTGAGQYKTISDYFTNSTGSYAVVNSEFTTSPENGTTYEINPRIDITGDGFQTTNAVARGLINSLSTNSIYRVEMLERGAGYYYATAQAIANAVVGVTVSANLRPIHAPALGHGSDPSVELGSEHIGIGISFANSESNTIPTDNSFEKIGILRDPKFANVAITYADSNGTFVTGEKLYKINPVRLNANATINTTSVIVSCNTGDFQNQFTVGEQIYLRASNTTSHMLTTVASITNATSMNLASNGLFACTDVEIFQANTSASAWLNTVTNSTSMATTNVVGIFQTGDVYVGNTSGAKAVVNTIVRNDVTKGFDTFVQMHKYFGEVTSGVFTEDELIFQGAAANTSTANASLHSVTIDGSNATFYTSNQVGVFQNSVSIEGNSSGATGVITNRFGPELVHGAGQVLSIENIDSVNRANTHTETLKLLFNFGA